MIATYDDALRSILGLPTLEGESWGARRVVQCLFKPSFHPECAISLVERGDAASLTVRVPSRPVWALVAAGQDAASGDAAADWVKPAISTEHVAGMPQDALATWRGAMDAVAGARPPERATIGLDGMSVDVLVWSPAIEAAFGLWFGPFRDEDARHRLVRAVLQVASGSARREESTLALRNVSAYLYDSSAVAP